MTMQFFDANTSIGTPVNEPAGTTATDLLTEMDRAGIERALVWHIAQRDTDPLTGNALLTEAIQGTTDRLAGCWSILPTQTGELGDLNQWFADAAGAGVRAMRAWPTENRYLLRYDVVGAVLERLVAGRWPLVLTPGDALPWPTVYDLLAEAPELTVILSDLGVWGADRFFRPLIEHYPNVYVEISDYMLDGGIEAFVTDYGSGRLLFGSGWPTRYTGGMMLTLATAEISDTDKAAIAGGNLRRLIEGVRL